MKNKIIIDRDSVCMGDDCEAHEISISVDEPLTYNGLLALLDERHYLPSVSGNNVVWVFTANDGRIIFTYFTKTKRVFSAFDESLFNAVINADKHFKFLYYYSPLKWKEKLSEIFGGDVSEIEKSAFIEEYKYCDTVERG